MLTNMKTNEQRLNNIIGQLNGIKRQMADNEDCLSVLNQLKAAKSAVASLMEAVAEEKFNSCLGKNNNKDILTAKRLFAEVIKK